jgi:hypothetical protein
MIGMMLWSAPERGDSARSHLDDNAAMGKVIFLMNVSLDGYIETPDHSLDWTVVDRHGPRRARPGHDARTAR